MSERFGDNFLRRSALFVPADNQRALKKACNLDADVVIIDLEDSVAPEHKESAREAALQALRHTNWRCREKVLRINGSGSPWQHADLAIADAADALLIPKVESPRELELLSAAAGTAFSSELWIMCETPTGVLQLGEILKSFGSIAVVVVGSADLGSALRVPDLPDRPGLLAALGHCVLQARAHGASILDGVHTSLTDLHALRRVCAQGRALGFDGKTLIHPAQIPVANQIFAPDVQELRMAHKIIEAWRQAREEGRSVAVVNGRLVEDLHVRQAQRVVQIAQMITQDRDMPTNE